MTSDSQYGKIVPHLILPAGRIAAHAVLSAESVVHPDDPDRDPAETFEVIDPVAAIVGRINGILTDHGAGCRVQPAEKALLALPLPDDADPVKVLAALHCGDEWDVAVRCLKVVTFPLPEIVAESGRTVPH